MPNYGLVINSRFRPFSYAEMLAPVQQQTEAHQALEEAYGALGTQAGTVESMLNRELDRDAYNQYQGYMKGLQEQADILSKEGLNPSVRNSLMNMRRRYSQEIIPIQRAAERREKLAEEQRKLGNSMIFDIEAATTGLNEFMNNPTLNYRSIDRKDLYSRAMNDFGQLANDLASYGRGRPVDSFTNTFVKDYGITRQQATDFVNAVREGRIDGANPVLRAIYDNLYNSTGVSEWNNPQANNLVQNTILEGVAAAIGKSDVSTYANQAAIMEAQYQRDLALLEEKNRLANKERRDLASQSGVIVPLRSRRELAENNRTIESYLGKGYFKKNSDGTYSLTQKGFDAMYHTSDPYTSYDHQHDGTFSYTNFGKFMVGLNGGNSILTYDVDDGYIRNVRFAGQRAAGTFTGAGAANNYLGTGQQDYEGFNRVGRLFTDYVNANTEQAYDTFRTTEIDIPLNNEQGEVVTEAIWRAIPSGQKIEEVDFDGNNRTWTNIGRNYSAEDLAGYRVTALRPSMYGMTAFLHKDGKDDIRIQLPRGVNIGNLDAIQQGMTEVNAWIQAANSQYVPMFDNEGYIVIDGNGNAVFTNQRSSEADRNQYRSFAEEAKTDIIDNSVTIVRPTTATTERH